MAEKKIAPSPAEVLVERFLEPNGITQYRLAKAIGKPHSTVNKFVTGNMGLSPEMATLLGDALGTGAEYWMDVDAAYKLSKVDAGADVERLLEDRSFVESGGYTFSDRALEDASIGRAVRGVYGAMKHLTAEDQEDVGLSVSHYLMYRTIEFPGVYGESAGMDNLRREVFAIFYQFLIAAGESPEDVDAEARRQWDVMVSIAKGELE